MRWLRNARRKRIRRRSFPAHWRDTIAEGLWLWRRLTPDQQRQCEHHIPVFIAEKNWEPVGGLVLEERMQVTVAAAASLLLCGFRDDYCFDRVRTIILHPEPVRRRAVMSEDGLLEPGGWLAGEALQWGPIMLSWDDVEYECRTQGYPQNIVLHEFAHHIDGLDGEMSGHPPFATADLSRAWRETMREETEQLQRAVERRARRVLDSYALENDAEFFAVATEAFFCRARLLQSHHPRLYDLLAQLYRLDPAA